MAEQGSPFRTITILGPGKDPLWRLDLALAYLGPDRGAARNVVTKTPSIRVLLEQTEPLIKVACGKPATLHDMRPPTLARAAVRPEAGGGRRRVEIARNPGTAEPTGAKFADVALAPIFAAGWPAQSDPDGSFPATRLASGRIALRINPNQNSALTRLLDLKASGEMFGGLAAPLDNNCLELEFTPDGVEFDVAVPVPGWDLFEDQNLSDVLFVRVNLCRESANGSANWRLQLVDRAADPHGGDLRLLAAGLKKMIEAVNAKNARFHHPLLLDFDSGRVAPPLSWPLNFDKVGVLTAPWVPNAGGARPRWLEWKAELGVDAVRARLATEPPPGSREPSLAQIFPAAATLARTPSELTLGLKTAPAPVQGAAPTPAPGAEAAASWAANAQRETVMTLTTLRGSAADHQLPVAIEAHSVARRLKPLYEAAHALPLDPAASLQVFLTVDRGWLQLGEPKDSGAAASGSPQPATPSPAAAMAGSIALALNAPNAPRREIFFEAAASASVEVKWTKPAGKPSELNSVKLALTGAAGRLSGLLFFAETSPTPAECLPTLRAGAAATRDLPLLFGARLPDPALCWNGSLAFSPDAGSGSFGFTVTLDQAAIAWLRHPVLPVIPAAALTRSAQASRDPLHSSGLLPRQLKKPFKLELASGAAAPAVKGDWIWCEEWRPKTGRGVPLVIPTLPGIELAPAKPDSEELKAVLRYDLPALDAFFAAARLPPPKDASSTGAGSGEPDQKPEAPPTAVDFGRLARSWRAVADALELARTQAAAAFDPRVEFEKELVCSFKSFVEPYPWHAKFKVTATCGADLLPLGGYSLDGRTYSGESALIGMAGDGEQSVRFKLNHDSLETNGQGAIIVAGFAAALYQNRDQNPPASGCLFDSRGFGLEPKADTANASILLRSAALVRAVGAAPDLWLFATARRTISLKSDLDASLEFSFWFRDLPLFEEHGKLRFDGGKNPAECGGGPDGAEFDRDRLPFGLHEWRFYKENDHTENDAGFAIRVGPFFFWPLRLIELTVDKQSGKVLSLSVLGRFSLLAAPKATNSPFGPDEPYGGGNLVMLSCKASGDAYEFSWKRVDAPAGGQPKDSNAPLSFPIKAVVDTEGAAYKAPPQNGSAETETLKLELQVLSLNSFPPGDGFRLVGCLFGKRRELTVNPTGAPSGEYAFLYDNPDSGDETGAAFVLTSLLLALRPEGASCKLKFLFRIRAKATLLILRSELPGPPGTSAWLGLPLKPKDGAPLFDVAIADGRLTARLNGVTVSDDAAPIAGFKTEGAGAWELNGVCAATAIADDAGGKWSGVAAAVCYFEGRAKAASYRVRHLARFVGKDAKRQRLELDWTLSGDSIIGWPKIDVSKLKEPKDLDPGNLNAVVIDVGSRNDDLLHHQVTLQTRGLVVPIERLAAAQDASDFRPRLTGAWSFLAEATHTFGNGATQLKWRSLDHVSLADLGTVAAQSDSAVEFTPRYKDGAYRGLPSTQGMQWAGLGTASAARSGLADHFLEHKITQSEELIVSGGGVTLIEAADPDMKGRRQGRRIAAPWILSASGAPLSEPLDSLNQCAANDARSWRIADYDATPGALTPLDRALPKRLPSGLRQDDIAGVLRQPDRASQAFASRQAVEQCFVEYWEQNKATPEDKWKIAVEEALLFASSLIALRRLWAAEVKNNKTVDLGDRASALIPLAASERAALAVCLSEALPDPAADASAAASGLVVLSRAEIAGPFSDSSLGAESTSDGKNVARLLAHAEAVIDAPEILIVAAADASLPPVADASGVWRFNETWQVREAPRAFGGDPGTTQPLRTLADTCHASPALGWPSGTRCATAAALAVAIGGDAVAISKKAGLAGRSATFAVAAWAPSLSDAAVEAPALYLSSVSRVVFDRPKIDGIHSPPATHLSLVAPRQRTPVEPKAARRPPILPPQFERAFIGARPGVFHAFGQTVLIPAEPVQSDGGAASGDGAERDKSNAGLDCLGSPAAVAPLAVQQARAPRGTALPDETDLGPQPEAALRLRRTFVSDVDMETDSNRHLRFLAFDGYAATLRPSTKKFIARLTVIVTRFDPDAGKPLSLAITGEAKALAQQSIDVRAAAYMARLWDREDLAATLCVGDARFQFSEQDWRWKKGDKSGAIDLLMAAAEMTGAKLALAAATADTPLRLELTLPPPDDHTAPDDDHRDGVRLTTAAATDLKDGPPRTLVIPLQIPPGDRPTLAVDVGTIVFADRSYDQQLAGAAKMDTRIELTTAGPRKWRLSADRFKYDLASTIYFAFGHIVESTGEFDALGGKWRLNITLLRGAGEIQLVISGVKNTGTVDRPEHGVDAGDAYAIPLGALLVVPGNAPAALRPDDKLRIRVTPGNGSGVSLPSPCEVTVEITAEPVITPAPSVFALIELLNAAAAVPLHAVAPTPTTIEFPDLPGDLALGSVRRNALFEWSWPRISGGGSKVSLLKIDRSGFGQIPDKNDAFKSLQKAPL